MKILLFSSKFPPMVGGVENVVYNLAHNFKMSKHHVVIVSSYIFNKNSRNFFKILKKENYNSLRVYRVFMSLPRSLLGFLIFPYRFLVSFLNMVKIIKKESPDIIHFHFPDDSLYYFYLLTIFNFFPPFVLSIHGNELHLFSKKIIYRFFLKSLLNKSCFIVVNSTFMKEELIKNYSQVDLRKVKIIPNGINIKDFYNKNPSENLNSYFLFVGRLAPKKGVDILIKAYNKVCSKISRNLYILGPEVTQGKPLHFYKNLSKCPKIKFLGKVTGDELKEYFKKAYFTVFPSRIEPFGIVALESLSSGTPFIASNTGGLKEIAQKTNGGILFKNKSVSSLAKTLLKIDSDTSIKKVLQKNGLKNILFYDWETISKNYLNLYEKAKASCS